MGVRRESVHLSLQDDFSPGALRAAGAAQVLARAVDGIDGASVKAGRSMSPLGSPNGPVATVEKQARLSEASINQLTGRLRVLADVAALVGPGLIPIGAVGLAGVAGLASQLSIAAIAGGSAIVAFQGVGDAVKAISAYKLDPTVENLQKAQEALSKLGPDAAAFAIEFQAFIPVLKEIRDGAAAGWFPGLTESLEDFETLAPKIVTLFENVGRAGGDAVADAAESFTTDRWTPFFDFLATEAPAVITDLSAIVGDLTHGAAMMWMAFDPGNDDFTAWLKDVADGFDDWSSSAQGRQDIAGFLDYVSETGPDVADAFGSLVNMLTQVVQAAAPLGGPVLQGISAVADVVATIAESDLGTPIFVGMAALAAYNRVLAMTAALQKSALGQSAGGKSVTGFLGGFTDDRVKSTRSALQGIKSDVSTLGATWGTAGARTAREQERMGSTAKSLGKNVGAMAGQVTRAGAPIAGLALLSSGAADSIGLTNTASLGLMGTMGGPWGAAIGASVGLIMDFSKANGAAADRQAQWTAAIEANAGSFGGQRAALGQAKTDLDAYVSSIEVTGNSVGDFFKNLTPGAIGNRFSELFGTSNADEARSAYAALERQQQNTEAATAALNTAMGGSDIALDGSAASAAALNKVLTSAAPAMDALGISAGDLGSAYALKMSGLRDELENISAFTGFELPDFDEMVGEIQGWQVAADSAAERTGNAAAAIASLGDVNVTTADSVTALKTALDALLSPQMDLVQTTDAWNSGLRNLGDELAESGRSLVNQTDAADQNRAAINGRIKDLTAMLTAEAAAGAGPQKLARILSTQRQALMETGVAMGLNRQELRSYLTQMGLTPAAVRTIFEAVGVDRAERQAIAARTAFRSLPKNIKTDLRANPGNVVGTIDRILGKYKLTEKQRTALLSLKDMASKNIAAVLKALGIVDKTNPKPRISLNDGGALGVIGSVISYLNNLDGKVATTYIRTVRQGPGPGRNTAGGLTAATGGYVTGPGTTTSDSIPALLSNKEFVINAAAVQHYGLDKMFALNERRLAAGGPADVRVDRSAATAALYDPAARGPQGAVFTSTAVTRRALEDKLAVAQAIQSVRELQRSLRADGKDRLKGLDRRIAALQLEAAQRELRLAKTREEREERTAAREKFREARQAAVEKLRERREALRGIGASLSFDSIAPDNRPVTAEQAAVAQVADFRAQIVAAGGVWTKALERWSKGLVATASELDAVQAALAAETAKRDELVTTLGDQQRQLDDLVSTMASYSASVAGQFLNDPFNKARTTTRDAVGTTPELEAQRAQLSAAEQQLAAIRSSATADSVESAAAASRLIAQIQTMRTNVEAAAQAASQPVEEVVSGLEALKGVLAADTAAAKQMSEALALLESKGLDTTGALGGLYRELAASGDYGTAAELAGKSEAEIDQIERDFAARAEAAAALAAQTTQAVYGEQQAALQALIAITNGAIAASDATMALLTAELDVTGENVRAGAAAGVAALQPQIESIKGAIANLPRLQQETRRKVSP